MTTNTEHRRRETDKLGPYVQQVALDNANERIAELEAGWQPIESALRDGSTIQLWHKLWRCPVSCRYISKANYKNTPWLAMAGGTVWPEESFTAWMPLPPPPSEKQGE